jgi:hypothetical protein
MKDRKAREEGGSSNRHLLPQRPPLIGLISSIFLPLQQKNLMLTYKEYAPLRFFIVVKRKIIRP